MPVRPGDGRHQGRVRGYGQIPQPDRPVGNPRGQGFPVRAEGRPLSIRELAHAVGVTHSAASQTAAQMARAGLLTLEPGADARQRIASLTVRTRQLLPLIEAEWAATDLAVAELEAELPAALGEILLLAERAVVSRPMRNRISDAARTLHAALPPGDPDAGPRAALLAIAGEGPEPA